MGTNQLPDQETGECRINFNPADELARSNLFSAHQSQSSEPLQRDEHGTASIGTQQYHQTSFNKKFSIDISQYHPHVLYDPSQISGSPYWPVSYLEALEFELSGTSSELDDEEHLRVLIDIYRMPYEEIMELGERIGNISIGLSKESIPKSLKKNLFAPQPTSSQSDQPSDIEVEICIICQMECEENERMESLDCGHTFHEDCIKKWLQVKNECAICKRPALETVDEREG